VLDRYDPDRVVSLGDSFQDEAAAERLPVAEREKLAIMRQGREWYWITGNHDPDYPDWLGGIVCPALTIEGIKFRHEPTGGAKSHEVAGHLHPAARLTRRGARVRRKCFISNGARLVVPAFGAYAGGLNVLNKAFAALFSDGEFHVWMLGRKNVYPVSKRQLLKD
jgi:DNA ligase-associated metallophosphoesterase